MSAELTAGKDLTGYAVPFRQSISLQCSKSTVPHSPEELTPGERDDCGPCTWSELLKASACVAQLPLYLSSCTAALRPEE